MCAEFATIDAARAEFAATAVVVLISTLPPSTKETVLPL